ncbi:MAG: hypothetical protein WAS27_02440 [Candidatus Saccharimonadales bacterium]
MAKKKTNIIQEVAIEASSAVAVPYDQTTQDFKHALLIVSLIANMFILIAWITLQATTIYDGQVAMFLFAR